MQPPTKLVSQDLATSVHLPQETETEQEKDAKVRTVANVGN